MPSTLGIVASGEDVFNDAVLWLDTARSVANETTMVNYGKGGSALNATYGSSAGADTNDPLLLVHSGTNYLYLPGVNSNNAYIPDAAALDITGDIEIVCRTALDDWTPSGTQTHVARQTLVDPNRGWSFNTVNTSGALQLVWWPTGSGASGISKVSTANLPSVDGTTYWLKATLDVDNGASGNTVRFYYAADQPTEPSSWTQLGADVVTAGVTSLPDITSRLYAGFTDGATSYSGKLYRAIVRNGIGGSTVADIDFTTGITSGAQASFTCTTGQTVTINRSTSGRKSVAVVRNVLLFGTDDHLEIADSDALDFGASDSFSVMAVHRAWNTQTTGTSLVAKKANTTATTQGWMLGSGTTTALQGQSQVGDGTNGTTATSASRTAGALAVSTLVRSTTADTVTTYLGSTAGTPATDATTGTSANTEAVRVGRLSGAGTGYFDGEIVAVAIWRRALSTNEIATAVARYA